MNFVELQDLKYYIGCNQENSYFYSTVSDEISCIDGIILMLSVSESEFRENHFYYEYIPLPFLNLSDALDGFIESLNNKKVSKYFEEIDKNDISDYWIKFDEFFHVGSERRWWNEYYDKYVETKAIDWCNEYGIHYH